jgi:hemoglobin-like flavoprotein
MTPHEIALVQDSFRRVVPIAGAVADIFYERLFATAPETRILFPEDLTAQKKLIQMLSVAVGGLTNLEQILPAVQDLGRRHGTYGVAPALYETVGSALTFTLRTGLGAVVTSEAESAWVNAYALLSRATIAAQREAELA